MHGTMDYIGSCREVEVWISGPVGGSSAETPHGHFGPLILYDHSEMGGGPAAITCHLHQTGLTADPSAHMWYFA